MLTVRFFHRVTAGIRVTVRPLYLANQSEPSRGRFVFAYRIRLENISDRAAQLLTRRWTIHDDGGDETEVRGDGVIGEQPVLAPGAVHEYQSYCVLTTDHGWMEGEYGFIDAEGEPFDVVVPRFELSVSPSGAGDA